MNTRGLVTSPIVLVSHPEVKLIDPAPTFEVGALLGRQILKVPSLGGVQDHVALIASGAHGREGRLISANWY